MGNRIGGSNPSCSVTYQDRVRQVERRAWDAKVGSSILPILTILFSAGVIGNSGDSGSSVLGSSPGWRRYQVGVDGKISA